MDGTMQVQGKKLNTRDEKFSGKKALGFSLMRAANLMSSLLIGQVTYFATNSLGITAVAISAGMAIKTVIDAITDLPAGAIVDGTHSRFGKARPYCLTGVLACLSTLFTFLVPTSWFEGMAPEKKALALVIYITFFATLQSAVFLTLQSVAYEVHIKRSIAGEQNRVKTLTIVSAVFTVGTMLLQVAMPTVIAIFHGSQTGFVIIAAVCSTFGVFSFLIAFWLCKEYSDAELAEFGGFEDNGGQEKVPVNIFLKSILKNKYIFMYTLINFVFMILMNSSFTTGQYYFQYVFGNLSKFSIVMASGIIILPFFMVLPKLCQRFGTVGLLKIAMIMAVGGVVLRMIFAQSIVAQIIGYLLVSLPNMLIAGVGPQISFECMEYGRYKTGVVVEAMYSSFVSFAQKMATSLCSLLVGVILTKTGFDFLTQAVLENGFTDWAELSALGAEGFSQYVTGGVDTVNSALSGISFAFNGIPLIFLIIDIVLLYFFRIEKDLKKLRVEHGLNEDGTKRED